MSTKDHHKPEYVDPANQPGACSRSRAAAGSVLAAKRISEYLTLGWNHNTPQAQVKMAEIIEETFSQNTED